MTMSKDEVRQKVKRNDRNYQWNSWLKGARTFKCSKRNNQQVASEWRSKLTSTWIVSQSIKLREWNRIPLFIVCVLLLRDWQYPQKCIRLIERLEHEKSLKTGCQYCQCQSSSNLKFWTSNSPSSSFHLCSQATLTAYLV